MNRVILSVCLLLLLLTPRALAQGTQYPNPNRQTWWNNLTDSIHTMGQTPKEAAQTKMRLHYQRSIARIKSINAAKRKAILSNGN